jgi:hypothetical protein
LVDNKRDGDIVRQETILNLGSNFPLPKDKWKVFCQLVGKELKKETYLFEQTYNDEYSHLIKDTVDRIVAKRIEKNDKLTAKFASVSDSITVHRSGIKIE